MRFRAMLLIFALSSTAVLLNVTPGFADSIDSNWCFTDGRHFSIDGPDIGYTGWNTDSRRIWPAFLPLYGAEKLVAMRLLDENTIQLTTGCGASETFKSPTQIWQRCFPVTS